MMGDKTGIEWTDATWNPVAGCSKVSPGCDNCYAIRQAHRLSANPKPGIQMVYLGTTNDDGSDWSGFVHEIPDRLDQPLRWTRPRRIFVNSMSDLFHPEVSDAFRFQVFTVMAKAQRHVFQVLTKRPQLMAEFPDRWAATRPSVFAGPTLPNVWLGTSIESDRYVFRADHLRETPAAVRWLSLEPLLGPLPRLDLTGIDWVVVGGESGPGARPMHPDWVRGVREHCIAQGVPFFFKQWGDWAPVPWSAHGRWLDRSGAWRSTNELDRLTAPPEWSYMAKVGKRKAGRLLDGVLWDQYPQGVDG